jgi:hypothetical protein
MSVAIASTGTPTSGKMPYGMTVQGCTLWGSNGIRCYAGVTGVTMTSGVPITSKNNIILGVYAYFTGNGPFVTEDYNMVTCTTFSFNSYVTAGAHTKGSPGGTQSFAPKMHYGQEQSWGGMIRPFLSPTAGSPYLNVGDGTTTSYDLTGRNRPEGS